MSKPRKSTSKLNLYFKENNPEKISSVAQKSGFSKSTISNYVRVKGYQNYWDFVSSFRKRPVDSRIEKFTNFVQRNQTIHVASSKNAYYLSVYLFKKLKALNFNSILLTSTHQEKIGHAHSLIFISYSSESNFLKKLRLKFKQVLIISILKPSFKLNNETLIHLDDCAMGTKDFKQYYENLEAMHDWIAKATRGLN